MELLLHAGSFRQVIQERVEDGPILRARVKRDEVPCAVVPGSTANGNRCVCVNPGRGKVLRAGPPDGGFPKKEDLVYL